MRTQNLMIAVAAISIFSVSAYPQQLDHSQESPYVFNDYGDIKTAYNRLENETHVGIFIPVIAESNPVIAGFEISAGFSYPGQEKARPNFVQLALRLPCTFAESLRFDPEIFFDQQWFSLKSTGICEGGIGRERISYVADMPYQEFLRVVKARNVKISFGNANVDLGNKQVDPLRKLASFMTE